MNTLLRRQALIGFYVVLVAAMAHAQATQPAPRFLRFVPDAGGGGVLQTSVITYRNKAGQTVDLVGAVHIADQRYFQELNTRFRDYDSVLYELVKPKDVVPSAPRERPAGEAKRPLQWVGTLQQTLKELLDLSFQLDEIDYSRPNFVHADLDTDTFVKMQEERGESMLSLMLEQVIREMTRPTATGAANAEVMDVAGLLMALQSPDRARQLKLILARQFNQMEDMLSGLGGPGGTVIVNERNRAALTVLRKRLDAGDKKIAIFYGAAHLAEMEKDLTGLMGFQQVGEARWITAWDMSAPGARGAGRPALRPATRPALSEPSGAR